MKLDLSSPESRAKFVMVFRDCVPVEGAAASAIYDLTRGAISTFPSAYYPLFALFREHRLGELIDMVADDDRDNLCAFLGFLHDHEYIVLVDDPSPFPDIPSTFESPSVVSNAIIDVNTEHHDYRKLIGELDALRCEYLQVRSYGPMFGLADLVEVARLCRGTSILSVEAILRHQPELTDEDYASAVGGHRVIGGLVVHSADRDRVIRVDYGVTGSSAELVAVEIKLSTTRLESHLDCGAIGMADLLRPSTPSFNELRSFHGCLNGKVSIDAAGEVRNCPAMAKGFGHHRRTALAEVVASAAFQAPWHHRNDDIEVCRDCPYRYACTGCRAFVTEPGAPFPSKPSKCGYDPYTDSWTEGRVHLPVLSSRACGAAT